MNDRPDARELLEAVGRFLQEEVVPALEGPLQFHARVAANLVRIVGRELECEEEQLFDEWRRLAALLQAADDAADPPARRALLRSQIREWSEQLAGRIRAGEADAGPFRQAVLDHLERTVGDKLAVARG